MCPLRGVGGYEGWIEPGGCTLLRDARELEAATIHVIEAAGARPNREDPRVVDAGVVVEVNVVRGAIVSSIMHRTTCGTDQFKYCSERLGYNRSCLAKHPKSYELIHRTRSCSW